MASPSPDQNYQKYGFLALLAGVTVGVLFILTPFVQAILWATILSILTYPLYQRFGKKFNETVSALLTILSTLVVVAIPLSLVGLLVFLQFRGFADDFEPKSAPTSSGQTTPHSVPTPVSQKFLVEKLPDGTTITKPVATAPKDSPSMQRLRTATRSVDEFLQPHLKQFNIDFSVEKYVDENGPELIRRVTGPLTRGATSAVVGVVMMVVAFLTMFFMLRDGHKLLAPARELLPLPPAWTDRILGRVQRTVHAVFMGVVLVAFIQGIAAGVGYLIVGVDGWLVWAAATMVLCAIPLLGSPIVYVPLSLLLLSQNKVWQGLFLLAWGFIVVSNIDNFLRPKYIGERVGLHYIAIFFSLLGGVLAFGPVGLMAGPMLLTITLELIAYLREIKAGSNPEAGTQDAPDPA